MSGVVSTADGLKKEGYRVKGKRPHPSCKAMNQNSQSTLGVIRVVLLP